MVAKGFQMMMQVHIPLTEHNVVSRQIVRNYADREEMEMNMINYINNIRENDQIGFGDDIIFLPTGMGRRTVVEFTYKVVD
ncbi:MAG: hypothetical protein CSA35_06645 [Dethiosulfovibrio peptidovorans]|nr:MAG: hypothetical protein CSA35_06645 [Dethiosulfovibrio peptidovorans]